MEGPKVSCGKRLERGVGAHGPCAVAVCRAEHESRERHRRDALRLVAGLEQRGQPLLPQTVEVGVRKRRPQDDIGHHRQRVGQARHGDVHPHGRGVESARGRERRAEKLNGVGNLQRGSRARAFVEHRGGKARQAELAGRVVPAARADDEVHLHERHLVVLDHPHRQPVGERPLLYRRKGQRGWWTERGRLRSILRDERHREAAAERRHHAEKPSLRGAHLAASGSTMSSTRRSAGSHRRMAAWMSVGESDV